jgi:hypothetical protein
MAGLRCPLNLRKAGVNTLLGAHLMIRGEGEDDTEKGRRGDAERQKMNGNPRVSLSLRQSYPLTTKYAPLLDANRVSLYNA